MTITVVMTCVVLTMLTLITRLSPLMIGGWLQRQKWVAKLSSQVPCMILVLLLLHDLEGRVFFNSLSAVSIGIGLGATLLSQRLQGRTVISIAVGVVFYMWVNWILGI